MGQEAVCSAACLDDFTLPACQHATRQQPFEVHWEAGWRGSTLSVLLPARAYCSFQHRRTADHWATHLWEGGRLHCSACLAGPSMKPAAAIIKVDLVAWMGSLICCQRHPVIDCLALLACSGDSAEGTEGGGAGRDCHGPGPHWERAAAAGAGREALDGRSQELDARSQGGHPPVCHPMCSWRPISTLSPGTVQFQAPASL